VGRTVAASYSEACRKSLDVASRIPQAAGQRVVARHVPSAIALGGPPRRVSLVPGYPLARILGYIQIASMASSNRFRIYLRQGTFIRNLLLASGTLLLAAIVNFTTRGPHRDSLLFIAVLLPGVVAFLGSTVLNDRIDSRLEVLLGRTVRQFEIVSFDFPEYRFVDAFNAIERQIERTTVLDSHHSEELAQIWPAACTQGQIFPSKPSTCRG